jgi:rhodanese-related sulfurtransferase
MTEPPAIDRGELHAALQAGTIVALDAQAPGWFERERIPGAIRALPTDLEDLEARLPDGRDTNIAVYCSSTACDASAQVARHLVAMGYRRVRRYEGGKRDWINAGLLVEASPDEASRKPSA